MPGASRTSGCDAIDPELPNEADFATSFATNSSVAGHLTQSELRGANYTLGAALYLFSNSAIIDRCSSGEAFCIFAAAALWAASPFLICSMTCSRHFFPISTNEFPVISTSHAPPSSLHVNFFILSSSFFEWIITACSISRRYFSRAYRWFPGFSGKVSTSGPNRHRQRASHWASSAPAFGAKRTCTVLWLRPPPAVQQSRAACYPLGPGNAPP